MEGLSAKNDLGERALDDVSLDVRAGEIVGVAGVQGNGQTELVEVVTGLRHADGGRVVSQRRRYDQRQRHAASPRRA